MTALEVFLAAFAAQCSVKVLEIAGRALREWFFTTADEAFDRPIIVTPRSRTDVSVGKMDYEEPLQRQRGWMGDRSGTPFGPAD